jgi:hypothetical protein
VESALVFKVIQLEGAWWAVFLVNPKDAKDRYMVTSPLDKKSDAEHFKAEFKRIAMIPWEGI